MEMTQTNFQTNFIYLVTPLFIEFYIANFATQNIEATVKVVYKQLNLRNQNVFGKKLKNGYL